MAIKKIIHCADIHLRMYKRLSEYSEVIDRFIDKCREECEGLNHDEVRIVVAGDLVHSYNNVSNELISMASNFLRRLCEFGKVIVFSGNHDFEIANTNRKDTLSTVFEVSGFDSENGCVLLDKEFDYKSGCYVDDNVIWALYSSWDNFARPDIEAVATKNKKKLIIGLAHCTLVGCVMQNGAVAEEGVDAKEFKKCDCVMMGHIHKRQVIDKGGIEIVYPGSLVQQDMGETVTQHGFCVWDLPEDISEDIEKHFVDIDNDCAIYKYSISSIDDIDNGIEKMENW